MERVCSSETLLSTHKSAWSCYSEEQYRQIVREKKIIKLPRNANIFRNNGSVSFKVQKYIYSSFTKLHASRPRKDPTPVPRGQKSPTEHANFAALLVLSCLHSPGLWYSCCNVAHSCCDFKAQNLVMDTITHTTYLTFDNPNLANTAYIWSSYDPQNRHKLFY
jgi:hypothetical protein